EIGARIVLLGGDRAEHPGTWYRVGGQYCADVVCGLLQLPVRLDGVRQLPFDRVAGSVVDSLQPRDRRITLYRLDRGNGGLRHAGALRERPLGQITPLTSNSHEPRRGRRLINTTIGTQSGHSLTIPYSLSVYGFRALRWATSCGQPVGSRQDVASEPTAHEYM